MKFSRCITLDSGMRQKVMKAEKNEENSENTHSNPVNSINQCQILSFQGNTY